MYIYIYIYQLYANHYAKTMGVFLNFTISIGHMMICRSLAPSSQVKRLEAKIAHDKVGCICVLGDAEFPTVSG